MNPILFFLMLFPFLLQAPSVFSQEITETPWERKWEMKPGIYRVLLNGKVGIVDDNNELLVPCQFDQVYGLNDDHFVTVLKDFKIGLYHLEKGLILPAEYDQIWPFENERAKVLINGKMGLVNTKGQIVIPPIYDQISPFDDGMAMATIGNESIYINHQGQLSGAPVKTTPIPSEATETSTWPDSTDAPARQKPAVKIGREQVNQQETYSREITIRSWPDKTPKKRRHHFNGHLSGITLGINGYLDEEMQETVPADYGFMSTIHEKSIEFGIYPFQQDVRLIGSHVGLVTAIGLKYNNYRFDIGQMTDINEAARPWFPDLSDNARISKSKLTTVNLSIPLVFEVQIPEGNGKSRFYLNGGIEGNLRLKSHTKLVFRDEGSRDKRKKKGDFGLNGLRYNFIARAGYDDFGIYATYSPVPLFKSEAGPELYPYSVGITFSFD
ncbi:WG repeat-containing protein [Geofilum rubicundum]|uniref:Outer membrane protein beta-barrel domain-containing protein n=1 Tax=Geofilum rubicundum JCM 15548 TaxID=1236989 RepID=A0A0E9LW10_9BACT|nr:WG repeat-containing protein [Geofilum rubicundum]GAO29321.1 hypothetical protein JCM15548_11495 [Geofilum rubicundum JCM 15548]